jgi:NADH dehydrogenase
MSQPHVVIIGGGFGGLAAARALAGSATRVTLIDRANHHLFQPLLYQVATAGLAPSDIAEPLRSILARQANAEVRLAEVDGIDLAARTVQLGDGATLTYDKLVVAAGSRTSWFGHDEWEPVAPGLKTLGDALEIRRRVLLAFERAEWTTDPTERGRLLTFVVVGGGPTGVEVAGALQEVARSTLRRDFRHLDPTATRVILVEAAGGVLNHMHRELQASARRQLESLGVTVWTGRRVQEITEGRIVIDGEELRPGAIIWAAGVRPSPLAAALGAPLDRGGRVIVEPDTSLPGHPEVFVIGDMASWSHGLDRPLAGVAPVALGMGQHAAACILADLNGRARAPLRYLDKGNMATIGFNRAVVEVRRLRMSGFVAWLAWVFVHLMTLVGHRNRVVVFIKWAWAWWTADRSSRLLWDSSRASPAPPAVTEK